MICYTSVWFFIGVATIAASGVYGSVSVIIIIKLYREFPKCNAHTRSITKQQLNDKKVL